MSTGEAVLACRSTGARPVVERLRSSGQSRGRRQVVSDSLDTPPTRVLWLAKGLGQGGMERLLVNHARFGDRDRFEYSAAFLVERPYNVIEELTALGVRVHDLDGPRTWSPGWVLRLIRLIRSEGIDVVHVQSPLVAAVVRPTLRALPHRPRLVYTEHNSWKNYRPGTQALHGVTFRLDDAHVAVSEPASTSPPRWVGPRAEVLVHGIDVDAVSAQASERDSVRHELGVDPTTKVIGMVANFRPSKAYPVMLEAAATLAAKRDDVLFVSVGQGPLQDEIERRAADLRLGDRFRFLGFRPDATRVMAGFDVFALSSDVEGLPVAVMEAKALGLPIVATSVGGLPGAIRDGIDGLLVPPRRPDELALALTRLADSPTLLRELGQASGGSAQNYDARNAVKRLEALYSAGLH